MLYLLMCMYFDSVMNKCVETKCLLDLGSNCISSLLLIISNLARLGTVLQF